ncbi:hypothetical protein [Methyloglobulus sp.]|uniref:hypothetical protein n=1 Tax=Methyloglobulus sp. TaxID=2518622 RepID=UPI003989856A
MPEHFVQQVVGVGNKGWSRLFRLGVFGSPVVEKVEFLNPMGHVAPSVAFSKMTTQTKRI